MPVYEEKNIEQISQLKNPDSSEAEKEIEIYRLRDEIELNLKHSITSIEGRLTVIDSKKPAIEIDGDRIRIDAFIEEIKIIRPEQDYPYIEVRRYKKERDFN